jgi:hypothetical protein
MADLPRGAEIGAGIIIHGDSQVNFVFNSAFDGFHGCQLSGKRYIKDVRAALRPEPYSRALFQLNAKY